MSAAVPSVADTLRLASAVPLPVAALLWAQIAPVFPIYEPVFEGDRVRCSCGRQPCGSTAKHPRLANGFHGASQDPAQIAAWWSRWPTANIGVPTGVAFDVLDIDGAAGIAFVARMLSEGSCPPVVLARQRTGRADPYGEHWLLPLSGRDCGKPAPGVDWKGRGGYVVVAPSRHASGMRYTALSDNGDKHLDADRAEADRQCRETGHGLVQAMRA